MGKTRVLVVEDSLTVRAHLREVLSSDPDIEVVGEAHDGKQAIELCRDLRPDVMTLDMMMPVMSGQAVTEYIMAHFPTPILIVSASTNRGELFKTYEALAAGAVDVMEKPRGESNGVWENGFLSTVKLVARIKVIRRMRTQWSQPAFKPHGGGSGVRVVGIGASTGGPGALVEVLRRLPAAPPWPILIVLHLGEPFGSGFADWLDGLVPQSVMFARGGEVLMAQGGNVWMAPSNRHLGIEAGRLVLSDAPERHSCRPSVDVLFESMAREYGANAVACLLTGMGRDGAKGMLDIKLAGGHTIAQDEATSIVYGMPREAVRLGAVSRVLPLHEIAPALAAFDAQPKAAAREAKP